MTHALGAGPCRTARRGDQELRVRNSGFPGFGDELPDAVVVDQQWGDVSGAGDLLDATIWDRGAGLLALVGAPAHDIVARTSPVQPTVATSSRQSTGAADHVFAAAAGPNDGGRRELAVAARAASGWA